MLKQLCLCAGLALAPLAASAEQIAFEPSRWEATGETHRFETHAGRKALFLEGAEAVLKDSAFENGVIEYDVMFPQQRGFIGVQFRRQADGLNYEDFYVRSHQANNPDANQYTPVFNGLPGWQIYYGTAYATPTPYKYGEWNHVKLVVKDDRADVYINSDKPILSIGDLKHEQRSGAVALWVNLTGAWFANLSVTATDDAAIVGEPAADYDIPAGTVTQWSISEAIPAAALGEGFTLPAGALAGRDWKTLQPETNGIVNLARRAQITAENQTVLARISVSSDAKQVKRFRFGFSDAVKVYVNGALMFDGDDAYQTRDYRHLGTVGLYDAVYVPLKKGRNDIILAVSETFGGWAVAGAFEDQTGISFE